MPRFTAITYLILSRARQRSSYDNQLHHVSVYFVCICVSALHTLYWVVLASV